MPNDNVTYDGFLSYARVDDEAFPGEMGEVSKFHFALELALKRLWSRNCRIFIDREIRSGERWRDVLENRLNEVNFMVAMLSPSFFGSPECRSEVEYFDGQTRAAGAPACILPVIVVDIDHVERDEFYARMRSLQNADYRKVRFEEPNSKAFKMFVADCASNLHHAIRNRASYARQDGQGRGALSAGFLGGNVLSAVGPPTLLSTRGSVEVIQVPAGEFLMGSEKFDDEKPMRRVYLDAYRMGKYPVTVGQFKAYCADTGIEFRSFAVPDMGWKDDNPMVNVNWSQARDFCKWAGGDLPTEAQWEKAARGTDGREYPWGERFDSDRLHCSKRALGDAKSTAAVGSFPSGASPYGCLDMAGNVWEWCLDWWGTSYGEQTDRNPTGRPIGVWRILRGGSWRYVDPAYFRTAKRNSSEPGDRFHRIGFRLAVQEA